MAVILSKEGEEVVYRTKRHEEGVECDVCGAFIKVLGFPITRHVNFA